MIRHPLPFAFAAFAAFATFAQTATACPQPPDAARMTKATLAGINDQRAARNLPPVSPDPRLTEAAQNHACDSAARNRMGHKGSDGSTLADRARRVGYGYRELAENVAQGYPGPAAVIRGWMASQGHRRNILMRDATDAGLGLALGSDGDLHWVLVLGRD